MHVITADEQKRLLIPDAKPGQAYDYSVTPDGVITLKEVKETEPRKYNTRVVREGDLLVLDSDAPFDRAALDELIKEFP